MVILIYFTLRTRNRRRISQCG